jgi:hypothetical protein
MPPEDSGALSKTFQIHVQTLKNDVLANCIDDIAAKHNLAVKRKDNCLVVYKPYSKAKESLQKKDKP